MPGDGLDDVIYRDAKSGMPVIVSIHITLAMSTRITDMSFHRPLGSCVSFSRHLSCDVSSAERKHAKRGLLSDDSRVTGAVEPTMLSIASEVLSLSKTPSRAVRK